MWLEKEREQREAKILCEWEITGVLNTTGIYCGLALLSRWLAVAARAVLLRIITQLSQNTQT